jgi:hypothetical protein
MRCVGWASTYYGGEDTRFCERLAQMGVMIHSRPDLVVFHHRRALFRPHMCRIADAGRHRGYVARVDPGTSLRTMYFAPLIAVVALCVTVVTILVVAGMVPMVIFVALVYVAAALMSGGGTLAERPRFPLSVFVHHASYDVAFARGLAT